LLCKRRFIKRAIRRQMKFENLNRRADARANYLLNWLSCIGQHDCQLPNRIRMKCDAWRQLDGERNQAFFGDMDWRISYYCCSNSSCLCSLLLLSHGEMSPNCQIEHGATDSDVGTPCSNRAVATCAGCGAAICSDCRRWCCGQSFCQWCGDYRATHSCLRKQVENEQQVFSSRKAG